IRPTSRQARRSISRRRQARVATPSHGASASACRAGRLERVEAAAEERDDRVDLRRDVVFCLRFSARAFASLGQYVEGRGERRGNDLWAKVVFGCVKVIGDRRGDQLLEGRKPGAQVTAERLVAFDAETHLLVRSEERRVGKASGRRWSRHINKTR